MAKYDYQCLYCGHGDVKLAGFDDHMTLCSRCGNLMIRADQNFFWQFIDKNQDRFSQVVPARRPHPPESPY
jgi:hypothetical protein